MSSTVSPSTSAAELSSGSIEDLPGRIKVTRELGALTIDWSWRHGWVTAFLVLWCAVWDLSIIAAILSNKIPILFMLTHGGAGLVVTYILMTRLFNRTRIEVNQRRLHVRVGPFPWPGKRDVDREQIEQLFVKKVHRTNKGADVSTFNVAFQTKTREVDLVKKLETAEQAATIESLIEEYLQIEDRPVPGEFV